MMTKKIHDNADEIYAEDFLNNLLLEAGFDPEEDDFDLLKSDLEPLLMDTIMTKVFEALSEEQREEIIQLFDNGKEDEALEKVETMIPDYDNFLADVVQEFREDYLKNLA